MGIRSDSVGASCALAATFLILGAALPVRAATDTVTSLADDGSSGTLRSVIAAAAAGDTIVFSVAGTITLNCTTGVLVIRQNLTINGPGAPNLTISGANECPVFFVSDAVMAAAISGLTIANGRGDDGGGISNYGTLTVSNCAFSGNFAAPGGAINNGGALTVSNCVFSGNTALQGGGAIFNTEVLTVNSSTFSGNLAFTTGGGGIFIGFGTVTVNNSTLSGNTAEYGGGLLNVGGMLTINNSIVAGNTSTSEPGDDCEGCNVIGGTNLISTPDAIVNPLLSPLGWYGGPTQTMLPLPGSPAIGTGVATPDEPNMDQRGFKRPTSGAVDLGAVQTHYLIVTTTTDVSDGTPACDANGDAPCSLRDALTVAKPGGADIAFAAGLAGTVALNTVNTPLPAITGNLDLVGPGANILTVSGGGSASVGSIFTVNSPANAAISGIAIANASSPNGSISEGAGTLSVSNITFSGNAGGAIDINFGTLTVNNCTFSGNTAELGGGGAIFANMGTLTVTNSTFSGNATSSGGGGIFSNAGTLTINYSTLSGNTAALGGGIFSNGGTLTVNNSIVAGNAGGDCYNCGAQSSHNLIGIAPQLAPLGWYGGPTQTLLPLQGSPAICAGSVSLDPPGLPTDQRGFPRANLASGCLDLGAAQTNYLIVTTTTDVSDGTPACDANGDSPCSLHDALTVVNPSGADVAFAAGITGTIVLNSSLPAITGNLDLFGPGAANLTVSGATVGNIFLVKAPANAAISGIAIANASGGGDGGGIYESGGTLAVSNCTFSGNSAVLNGGSIDESGGTLTVSDCTFSGNTAGSGGAIFLQAGLLTVNNSTLSGNTAVSSGSGGGIFNLGALIVNNSTFSGNTAGIGGGIANDASVTLNNSIVAGNTSTLPGDDCDGCGAQSSNNLIGIAPQLAPLASYGGPTATMLPLPGSPAICAGSASLNPAGLGTDQRGFPRLNTSYSGYSAAAPCLDLGAVQTNYQSVQFTNAGASGYSGTPGVAVSTPAAPVVSVTENGQNIGNVPVTLSFSGTQPTTASGLGPVTTVAGTGATFPALTVSPGGDYTLLASLTIVGSDTISNTAALDISNAGTTTGIVAPAITYGSSGLVTVTVTSLVGGTVTGNVSLTVNGTTTYTQALVNGSTTFTLNGLSAGPYSLSASYAAQNGFGASSMTGSLQVNQASSTTAIASHTPNPSVTAQAVTVAFTVSPVAPATSAPTGTVTVSDGTGDSCTASVSVGQCLLTIATAGMKTLTASYGGDTNFVGSFSAGVSQTVYAATTTGIIAPAITYGSPGQVTVTVTSLGGTVTGNVSLTVDGTTTYTQALASGSAIFTITTGLSVGPNSLSASYAAQNGFGASSMTGSLQVNQAGSTTTAIKSHTPNPSVTGQGVTVAFTVSPVAPATGTPTGTVTVSDGTGDSCMASVSAGQCLLTITTAGAKTLTASYGGSANFGGSVSAGVAQTVNKAHSRTTITTHLPNPSVTGEPVVVGFTVVPVAPGSGTPTGNVTITDLFGNWCTATVAAGSCSMTITFPGPNLLVAGYSGDSNFIGSLSANFTHDTTDFAILARPPVQSITPGSITTYTVALEPISGFRGAVGLACSGAPADSTCTVSPNPVSLTGTGPKTSTVTLQTTSGVKAGTYKLTLTGTFGSGSPATGGLTHSTSVTLTVR